MPALVGGFLAEELSRIGVSPLRLVDFDVLEEHNLVRHPLGARYLGKPKASSLASKIRQDFPLCRAEGIDANFLELPPLQQRRLVREADVVVAATDTFECQRFVNRICLVEERPAVYPGVWVDARLRDAEVSEILWVLNGRHTPCYECAVAFREGSADAQAGRGARVDMQFLILATAKVVMALLDPTDTEAAVLDPEHTCIYVHGFSPTSPSIRDAFPTEGMRSINVHVPFPDRPCPACGGQNPPVEPVPPRPLPVPGARPRARPVPGGRRPVPPSRPRRSHGGLIAAAAAALALIGLVIFIFYKPGSAPSGSPTSPGVASPQGASALPTAASTSFDVSPSFTARTATVSGVSDDSPGNAIGMSLTPTLNGFELDVQVSARYTAADLGNMDVSEVQDIGDNCVDIATPEQGGFAGGTYYEAPLKADLVANGASVTGTLTYPAILPGTYSFDLNCLSRGGMQSSTIELGRVTTGSMGVEDGTGDNDNALVVYSAAKSTTDTVILYGAIGASGDGSEAHPTAGACIVSSPSAEANPVTIQQASVAISQQGSGNGTWYELGALRFNLPASRLNEAEFFYNCNDTNGGGVPLP